EGPISIELKSPLGCLSESQIIIQWRPIDYEGRIDVGLFPDLKNRKAWAIFENIFSPEKITLVPGLKKIRFRGYKSQEPTPWGKIYNFEIVNDTVLASSFNSRFPWDLRPVIVTPKEGEVVGPRPRIRWKKYENTRWYVVNMVNQLNSKPVFSTLLEDLEWTPDQNLDEGTYKLWVGAQNYREKKYSLSHVINVNHQPEVEKEKQDAEKTRIVARRNIRIAEKEKNAAEYFEYLSNLTRKQNAAKVAQEIYNRQTILKSSPMRVSMYVGPRCNLDCIFCTNGRDRQRARMQTPGWVFRDVAKIMHLLVNLEFTGGEPLVYKSFDQYIDLCAQYPEVIANLCTNGILIDEQWARKFARGTWKISISVDAATPQSYVKIRRHGKWEKVVRCLEMLQKHRRSDGFPQIALSMNCVTFNYKEIPDFLDLALKYGIKDVHFRETYLKYTGPAYAHLELQSIDLLNFKDLCAETLIILDDTIIRGSEHGVKVTDRLKPYIFNAYPELIRWESELDYLPAANREKVKQLLGNKLRPGNSPVQNLPLGDLYGNEPFYSQEEPNYEEPNDKDQKQTLKPENSTPSEIIDSDFSTQAKSERISYWNAKPHPGTLTGQQTRGYFFCHAPFYQINLNLTDCSTCCYCREPGAPMIYKDDHVSFYDAWNGRPYQLARQLMYEQKHDQMCLTSCPNYVFGGFKVGDIIRETKLLEGQ
ncbi:MAG: radical SAM protein, partial [Planctomycetota bacterium]